MTILNEVTKASIEDFIKTGDIVVTMSKEDFDLYQEFLNTRSTKDIERDTELNEHLLTVKDHYHRDFLTREELGIEV